MKEEDRVGTFQEEKTKRKIWLSYEDRHKICREEINEDEKAIKKEIRGG